MVDKAIGEYSIPREIFVPHIFKRKAENNKVLKFTEINNAKYSSDRKRTNRLK